MNNRRRIYQLFTILGATFLLSGCVVSHMESYSDPDIRPHHFRRIAVAFQDDDLIHERRAERVFTAALAGEMPSAELVPALDLFRSSRRFRSHGDRLDELKRLGFDGYLAIDLREREIRYDDDPLVLLFDEPLPAALSIDGSTEFMAYNLDLVDVESGERVWTGTCHLTRTQLASFSRVMRALARRTASDLRRAGQAG
jgi:hypothetical protein